MLKLGAYESWFDGEVIVPGETLGQRLGSLEAYGYSGIQIHRTTMEKLGVAGVKKALSQSSVQLCICSLPRGAAAGLVADDPDVRRAELEQFKLGLRWAGELGAVGSTSAVRPVMARSDTPQTLHKRTMDILVDQLAQAAPVAEEAGVFIILEPLNRYESKFLNRLEQGVEICRAVGSPAVKIMADFFHMNIEEADIAKSIEQAADHIAYVHLADSNRYEPGAGHLDFRPGLAALKRIGYDGFMSLECRILGEDKGRGLIEAARYVREIWEQV